MRFNPSLICGAFLALQSVTVVAEDNAADWLVRMSDAARKLNYQGVVVYRDEDTFETLGLVHRNQNGQERERLVSLTGEPREISRDDDRVTCLLPRQRQLATDRPGFRSLFPRMTEEMVQKLNEHYELKVVGTARVAGRVCRGIRIVPKDGYRYGYQFWADEMTAVPLKVTLVGRNNQVIEQLVFTQVSFPKAIPDSAFVAEGSKPVARPLRPQRPTAPAAREEAQEQQDLPPSRWLLQQLPPGFSITMRDWRQLPESRGDLEHILVSDGLSAVSVFMASQPASGKPFQGLSHMGAVHAYGRVIGDFHIAVVGEVPMETVRLIGDGLEPTLQVQAAPDAPLPEPWTQSFGQEENPAPAALPAPRSALTLTPFANPPTPPPTAPQ
jgi:sigma-E factor negative regulatory protein RseB